MNTGITGSNPGGERKHVIGVFVNSHFPWWPCSRADRWWERPAGREVGRTSAEGFAGCAPWLWACLSEPRRCDPGIGWCDLGSDGHPYQKQVWVAIRYLPAIKVNCLSWKKKLTCHSPVKYINGSTDWRERLPLSRCPVSDQLSGTCTTIDMLGFVLQI